MGVQGLSTYMFNGSALYLKPYKLSNCDLIIDGSNVSHTLALQLKHRSAFGGDYDEYFKLVRNFMLALKKCEVNPIVVVDGASDRAKLRSRLSRRKGNIRKLNLFCKGFSTEHFHSLFTLEVFLNAARDVGVTCVQCYLEADGEIAAIAKSLKCPVLSNDSDYFIYDVLYIPFCTMKSPTPIKSFHSDKFYISCSIFNVNVFLKTIGFEKPALFILATLLGNDFVDKVVFFKFFGHLQELKLKKKSHTQKRIHKLMHWLRRENLNYAREHILSHLPKKSAGKVSRLFEATTNVYNSPSVSDPVVSELTPKFGNMRLKKNNLKIDWPPEIAKLYAQCFLPGFLANIVRHQFYLTPIQVENLYDDSSHFKSLELIEKIYRMITPYVKRKKPLTVYIRVQNQYVPKIIPRTLFPLKILDYILKEPCRARLNFLCEMVGVQLDDFKFAFAETWPIFIMSLMYWIKNYKNSVSVAHVHAFVIMMIANQIVKSKITGRTKKKSKLMENQMVYFGKLNNTMLTLKESSEFKRLLKNVSQEECHLVNRDLVPFREVTKESSGKEFSIITIHLFNSFQSGLFYINTINALLNYPLPPLEIENFYSGTLLFNLYVNIKNKCYVEKFGSTLFARSPNLNEIYNYLSKNLSKNLIKTEWKVKVKRKKKKRNVSGIKDLQIIHYSSSSEEEYTDDNNLFAVLRTIED